MTDPPTGGLLSIDPASGETAGMFPWRSRMFASVNAASPVVVGDSVFVTEGYTEGGALIDFAEDGSAKLRWKAGQFVSQFTTPAPTMAIFTASWELRGTEMVCYEVKSGRECGGTLSISRMPDLAAPAYFMWMAPSSASALKATCSGSTSARRAPRSSPGATIPRSRNLGRAYREPRFALREPERDGIASDLLRPPWLGPPLLRKTTHPFSMLRSM